MTPAELLESATADGLIISITPSGSLKVTGANAAMLRWGTMLRARKDDIIDIIKKARALPGWRGKCETCDGHHSLEVPGVGLLRWCCFEEDATHWRRVRLDTLTACPKGRGSLGEVCPSRVQGTSTNAHAENFTEDGKSDG